MLISLRKRYQEPIKRIEQLMIDEIAEHDWQAVPNMQSLIENYFKRPGKRLRPLLMCISKSVFSEGFEAVYPVAAALEIYHTATLIYDDIQDNSEFRRGLPCAHITTSTSMAMNQAGVIRSLMYQVIHRSPYLNDAEKLATHYLLDEAATSVSLGQSVDIGWHEGWYPTYRAFPYQAMIAGKTAALFGCAAASGALLGKANRVEITTLQHIGVQIGMLFQKVDDYLDLFGDPVQLGRPLYNDLREGKLSYPILRLCDRLTEHGDIPTLDRVLHRLAQRDMQATKWEDIDALMREHCIKEDLEKEFHALETAICHDIQGIAGHRVALEHLQSFAQALWQPISA